MAVNKELEFGVKNLSLNPFGNEQMILYFRCSLSFNYSDLSIKN